MKLKTLSTAMILATVPMTGAFAAALDRSGQSISAFLQPGNYAEAGLSVLDADVSGSTVSPLPTQDTGDMAKSYYFPTAALKLQVNDKFSLGLLYDQPFGANAEYKNTAGFTTASGNTNVEVHTQSLSLIFGYQPTENWNFYAGPVYQEVRGDVELQGAAYGATSFSGYKAKIGRDGDYGWLAGAAYQIPDIALKASLTYRSEIKHKIKVEESFTTALGIGFGNPVSGLGDTEITTPQSVNLDLQSGIMENTVAFANVRWVNWKDFSIRPYAFDAVSVHPGVVAQTKKPEGFDLVAYSKDQWSANVGVGRKFSDKWGANVSVGWDSGAGNPVTTLGPTEGYWNVGIGAQYSPAPDYFVQAGVKYFWLGDAKAQSGAQFGTDQYVADFEGNHAIGYGLKFGYKF
ncbi:OmpP1/FadL family transporter [Acinetobacter faecalis]|uniref:OmpP1/FadL family transporter n=1 Tax=Acinetobacter faecalis TaxID=2665161 RepID=UPI002A908623|nr:outer membrane protein transport protein [Acinetobacter faecalis]MDY6450325.1 outer membrane protein transport protein [Acinetobacter faecalis]